MPLRGNIGEPRTALLKFGYLRVMTVELIVLSAIAFACTASELK